MVTANQVDIDAGKLAKSKATSKDVRDFAQLMITDHSAVNKSATDLVTKLHVTPESNATSQSLQQGGDQNLAALKKLSSTAFDRAYVDHEVVYHQAVLDAWTGGGGLSAQNAELQGASRQSPSGLRGAFGARETASGRVEQNRLT